MKNIQECLVEKTKPYENPFFVLPYKETEKISRGKTLEEIYPEEYEERENFFIHPKEVIKDEKQIYTPSKEITDYIKKNIPLPGEASFSFNIYPTILGDYSEKGYLLGIYSNQWNKKIKEEFAFALEKNEEEPSIQEVTGGLEKYFSSMGYCAEIEKENRLNFNGYNKKEILLEKMQEIENLTGKKIIPIMRKFLVINFPKSHYGEDEKNDLTRELASEIPRIFHKKYNYIKRN